MNNYLTSNKELIVLEVANNHQGDFEHALKIIDTYSEVTTGYREIFNFAIKFQYRNLSTFIHPDFKDSDLKFVKRFLSTQLTESEFINLKEHSEKKGFISMCTPFDEDSVEKVIQHGYGILKIASASLDDWPLLEAISKHNNIEVIASVGGSSLEKIKRFYSFMKNHRIPFGLNYCVSLYPSTQEQLNLSFIHELKNQFKDIKIGFSTHEGPNSFETAGYALHAGASIFEKHIALEDTEKKYYQNDYSVYPSQLNSWLEKLRDAKIIYGNPESRDKIVLLELEALRGLKRGVFASTKIDFDSEVNNSNTFFAIPAEENQLLSNDLSKFNQINIKNKTSDNAAINYDNVMIVNERNFIEKIRDEVKLDLENNNITTPKGVDLEISHHYGVDSFYKFGTCMCTLVNKDYCKKILYQFPGQTNPEHFHKIKEETFILLEGDLSVTVDGKLTEMTKGDILTIERNRKHSFISHKGAIFEEISTEHRSDDSFYTDEKITSNKNRKSKILLN